MAEKKAGCAILIQVTCLDEEGKIISDIPSGGWYGFDRASANAVAIDIDRAVTDRIEAYNKLIHGEAYISIQELINNPEVAKQVTEKIRGKK